MVEHVPGRADDVALRVGDDVERHVVGPAGHMLHHDRPEDIARLIEAFLSESRPPRIAPTR